ncbi:MAG TPA: cysteine synthase family protein [Acidisarcina sp.]|nr:cysteine synthase family protein [Acidisarcina sp.]
MSVNVAPLSRRFGQSAMGRIGNTPLLRLDRVTARLNGVQILAKAEWCNPGGSVKDRAASNILTEALRDGKLSHGRILLDATSGNTGIAYAMLGAAYGFPVTLCMPANVSEARKQILYAYGAKIVYTDPGEGSDGAIHKARELHQLAPEKYFYADQYSNDANWRAHYSHGTADEIWRQTEGRVTHFVAMMGTSGTFVGTSRRLKELNPAILCTSLQPDSAFHGIEGTKHMATSIVPKIYDPSIADNEQEIRTEEAYEMARWLAREEGLLVGVSGAAALVGSIRVAQSARSGSVVITLFPDAGERYLSEPFWAEAQTAKEPEFDL